MPTVNLRVGLPTHVDVANERELQQAMDKILEMLQTWNGERGTPDQRVATQADLAKLQP